MTSMNLSALELRHLRYFLTVAETAHFTRAARRLHITQPTLSHQIKQLEGQVDQRLFDRTGRGVRLTAAGDVLRPFAERILRELDEARGALQASRGLTRGRLRAGLVHTVHACVIPEIISRFGAAHAGIQISCAELAVDDIEQGVESGRLDVGVSFLPATRKTLEGEKLFTEELVAVAAEESPLAQRQRLRVGDLAAEPLALLPARFCTRQLIDLAFATARTSPRVEVEMNSIGGILALVRQGKLASILPRLALSARGLGVRAIRLTAPTPRRSIGLIWRRGAPRAAAAELFAQVTTAVLRERGVAS
jgi:LysR family cyn operon transcriptional activator